MDLSKLFSRPAEPSRFDTGLTFTDIQGKRYDFQSVANNRATVFLFISGQCPIANVYTPRLLSIAAKYEKQGVQLFAVYSDRQEALEFLASIQLATIAGNQIGAGGRLLQAAYGPGGRGRREAG